MAGERLLREKAIHPVDGGFFNHAGMVVSLLVPRGCFSPATTMTDCNGEKCEEQVGIRDPADWLRQLT